MELVTIPVGPLQCNCYILWKRADQAVVIDPGDEGPRIVAALEARGLTPRLILNTHGHFDHVGGVDAVRDRFGATYRIHRDEIPILQMVPARTKLWGIAVPDIPTPKDFVTGGDAFDFAGLVIESIHTPGHTPGSTCYHVPEMKAVFTGDTLFLGSIGRTDFPGGSFPQIQESIKKRLLTLPAGTVVYPGHGPPTTIGSEAESNPFLV
ncbi:MAG: MBL fold metallo-hydrolase [Euryarchaeota archaeon]|nr:MBL fold metallo-hydrolase [Euryarchaeota archaeon]